MAATGLLLAGMGGIGAFCAATGSLATVIPQVLTDAGLAQLDALRLMFVAYGLTGVAIFVLYRALPDHHVHEQAAPYSPLAGWWRRWWPAACSRSPMTLHFGARFGSTRNHPLESARAQAHCAP
jgi:hypothetical protein